MRSVADALRRETLRHRSGVTAEARLVEALRLGDSAVELRRASTGESEAEARHELARQGARGRRPSRSAER